MAVLQFFLLSVFNSSPLPRFNPSNSPNSGFAIPNKSAALTAIEHFFIFFPWLGLPHHLAVALFSPFPYSLLLLLPFLYIPIPCFLHFLLSSSPVHSDPLLRRPPILFSVLESPLFRIPLQWLPLFGFCWLCLLCCSSYQVCVC